MKTREEAFYEWLYNQEPLSTANMHSAWKAGWQVAHDQIREALKKHTNTSGVIWTETLRELENTVRWATL